MPIALYARSAAAPCDGRRARGVASALSSATVDTGESVAQAPMVTRSAAEPLPSRSMMRMMGPHGMTDPETVKGVSFDRALFGRVWTFARPYRAQLVGFLVTIVLEAIEGLIPLLLIKRII